MSTQDFTKTIVTGKAAGEVFGIIKNVRGWWSGLYAEEITGDSERIGDEFSFSAGGGMHYSRQRLVELEPDKKIVWVVTDSNLTFLKKTDEWLNTKISFEITKDGDKTLLTFTHIGLVPKIECYGGCSSAWTQYLDNLAEQLK